MAENERRAPVQGVPKSKPAGTIPWEIHERAWATYAAKLGRSQSAERIAERGGFSYGEVQCLLGGAYCMRAACPHKHDDVPGWQPVGDGWAMRHGQAIRRYAGATKGAALVAAKREAGK